MKEYGKQRLFEMMNKVDKRFKINENLDLNNDVDFEDEDIDPNYIQFEVELDSKDYELLKNIINGALNKGSYFKKSKIGTRHYDDGRVTAFFNFHISEIPLLLKYLNELYIETNDPDVKIWIEKIENI